MDAATITALCTGIVTIITALGTLLVSLRNGKKADVITDKVNGHLTQAAARTEQLTAALTDVGVPVPPSPVVVDVPPAA